MKYTSYEPTLTTLHTVVCRATAIPIVIMDQTYDIVLFYKYVEIPDANEIAAYVKQLCAAHSLCGRAILAPEGINANLAGLKSEGGVQKLVEALQAHPLFGSEVDFKMDCVTRNSQPFPDLVVKVHKELCSTGGAMPLDLLHQGLGGTHLSPADFHNTLKSHWEANKNEDADSKKDNTGNEMKKELVVLDVRNKREYAIGRFMDDAHDTQHQALDPDTKVFEEWARYADKQVEDLRDKQVLMYCTGGIRCEKASAYLRSKGVDDVSQLDGGIHRYLDVFGSDGFFKGKNAVFDARGVQVGEGKADVVGKCTYCACPEESITSDRVCAVCRDGLLVCDACRVAKNGMYCCNTHEYMNGVYYPFLGGFSLDQLRDQLVQLTDLESTEHLLSSANRRRTVRKQIARVRERIGVLQDILEGNAGVQETALLDNCPYCRGCGNIGPDDLLGLTNTDAKGRPTCDGKCWGFMQTERKDEKFDLNEGSTKALEDLRSLAITDPKRDPVVS
ncbi:hypothetical protein SARC_03023 [Sphaeroforma arctica JP610]|uniref:Rhodanese domain-containing protein n=1 Tax=Sphaeroforma arctica JP610 TaxID=667725 RepID=A0A0L0G7B9_9EUKA|nr:hypothetical protein SARC_03023 [Sphaeroforma arctica JP610]KNC84781.1 hypothetical protein SARC_03023 [Sphaeroforma arctica JP610]|eukprot:XP_014158683.1 hypothetical protein SARC_03023 [Sphaeroforma arctica JP610]